MNGNIHDSSSSNESEEPVKQASEVSAESEALAKPQDSSGALVRDIGKRLKQARLDRDEKLEDMVRELKLRKVYLQALESGNWEVLPDEVYAIGFLRQYAAYLKVEIEDELHRIKSGHFKLTRPLTFPDPPVAPSRRWAWVAGIAFVLLFILFNVLGNHTDESMQEQAVVPQDSASEKQLTAQSKPAEPAASATASGLHLQETHDLLSTNKGSSRAQQQPAAVDNMAQEPAGDMNRKAVGEKPSGLQNEQTPQLIIPLHTFRFDAIDDEVWLQVYLPNATADGSGELKKEVLLRPGQFFSLQEPVNSLWLTIGNAGALQISVDGIISDPAGSIGEAGKVERDFKISAIE